MDRVRYPHTCDEAGLSEGGFYYGFSGHECQIFVGKRTLDGKSLPSFGLINPFFCKNQTPAKGRGLV